MKESCSQINTNKTFSVIIPLYNRADTIEDAVDSVLAQTYNNHEIIIVDDGSTDNFTKTLAQYGDAVTCISQENRGPAAARNKGIRHAQGEFVAFLDSDDAWLPTKLEKQLDCFRKNLDFCLIGTGHFNCDENLRSCVRQKRIKMAKNDKEGILIQNLWPNSSVVVRRFCFEKVGFFNEGMKFAEDWDMWIRIAQFFPVGTLEEPLVCFRQHSKGLAGSPANNDYNFSVWKKLIINNRKQLPGMNLVVYLKAMSFYYLNLSYARKIAGNIEESRWLLIKSICFWPFLLLKRF